MNIKSDTRYMVSGWNEVLSISCNYSFIQIFQLPNKIDRGILQLLLVSSKLKQT